MMNLYISLFIGASLMSMKSSVPLTLVFSLILSCVALFYISWAFTSKWVGYTLILIMLGGMMVVFLYSSVLSSNEKMVLDSRFFFKALAFMMIFSGVPVQCTQFSVNQLYSLNFSLILMFFTFYLLFVLVLVIKVCEPLKGSLSKKF